MLKRKILLVDDEKDLCETLKFRLEANGYSVMIAGNGSEGLRSVDKEKPDLIVLDVMMPVMNGFEFFKEIRARNDKSANIPIVMLTARGKMRDTFETMEAEAFLPKPFEPKELLDTIADVIKEKALVLNVDNFVKEKIVKVLEPYGYGFKFVEDEASMFAAGAKRKYRMIIAHMALVSKNPRDFVGGIAGMREKIPCVIIYSDATVKGLETGYTLAIDETRKAWKMAGVDKFYDHRISAKSFQDLIKTAIEIAS